MTLYFPWTFVAGEDLNNDASAGLAIAIDDGKRANNGQEASGILLPHSRPKSGEHGAMGTQGVMKFRAGGTVAAGNQLTVSTSGYFTVAASGYYIVGRGLEAVASGGIGQGLFNFSKGIYNTTSFE